jgi:WD40 repeat protein
VRATQAESVAQENEHRANAHAAQAEQKEQQAKKDRDEVRALNDKLQRTLYAAHMNLAQQAWDAQTGRELHTLKGHARYIRSVVFSPNARRLASVADDKTVKVWDAQTGQELFTFKGDVRSVAFSPDGHRLASGSNDGTVTISDATPLPEKP